ncbi:MAG: ComF family protein [Betaproteobacteria bacterium]|nr:ComF family protein [Betaproteobacteria bacterium]
MRFLNNCLVFGQHVLPQQCLLCAAPAMAKALCDACYAQLPWLPDARCPQCALPTADGGICGACLSRPPRFDRVSAAFVYAWPLAPLIHHYKYAGNLALATLLAQALSARLAGDADLIIPMPLAPQRLLSRGFNQALEIARVVSRATGVPLAANACRRVRDSAPQASLPWRERAQNIRGAFVCDADLQGKRVAVIDDVMTTGATLNELARNLRQGGALEVQGWMVARTL